MLDDLGISFFDISVIATILLGGLIGFFTGFIRGGLFVLSWLGAVIATLFGFALVKPLARDVVSPGWLADLVAGAALFLVALVVLHLISHAVSRWVRASRLNALDRSVGLVAGMTAAALVVAGAYLPLSDALAPPDQPDWLRQAKTRPVVEIGALFVRDLVPSRYRLSTGEALARSRDRLQRDAQILERFTKPPEIIIPLAPPAYKQAPRRQLDQLIETAR